MSRGDMDFAEKLHNAYNGKVIFHIYNKIFKYTPYDVFYKDEGKYMDQVLPEIVVERKKSK